MSKRVTVHIDQAAIARRLSREFELREGRCRASTFKVKKGKGSYTRKTKHRREAAA